MESLAVDELSSALVQLLEVKEPHQTESSEFTRLLCDWLKSQPLQQLLTWWQQQSREKRSRQDEKVFQAALLSFFLGYASESDISHVLAPMLCRLHR